MQIDFHYAVTYIVARYAGFEHTPAEKIAYCAEYVDNATNSGTIKFDNGAMYKRISTAHKMLDYRNFEELANHQVWIPFHFLPGNGLLQAGKNPKGSFINKLITRPNSPVAQDMMKEVIRDKHRPYALHRLGIASHVFIDTWAHQNFAGVTHLINDVNDIQNNGIVDEIWIKRLANFFEKAATQLSPPLGHGKALSYPDRPYAVWSYTNGLGERVERNNPNEFREAVRQLFIWYKRFIAGGVDRKVTGISNRRMKKIFDIADNLRLPIYEQRHEIWLKKISEGEFDFGPMYLTFKPKGIGSWKHLALGTEKAIDIGDEVYKWRNDFLVSDWKMFHDAAQAHRFSILHNILPRYGIIAA